MSDPITAGLILAGTTMSAIGSIQQGKAAEQAAEYNAQTSMEQAAAARAEGEAEAQRLRREGRRNIGTMRASISKSGVTSQGSPMLALAESAAMNELDVLNTRYSAQSSARASERQAGLQRAEGRSAKRAGLIGAGTSLLTGGAKASRSVT